MTLEFDDIFTSKGGRPRKEQRNTTINYCVVPFTKVAKLGITGLGQRAANGFHHIGTLFTRYSDNAYTTAPRRSSNGYDAIHHQT